MDEFADACKIAIARMYPDSLRLVERGAASTPPTCACGKTIYCRGKCTACYQRRKRRKRNENM